MLIFLFGEDLFRSEEKLSELKQLFQQKNPNGNLIIIDFSQKEASTDQLEASWQNEGLFSQKKLIISLDFLQNVSSEKQKEVLEKLKKAALDKNPDSTLIFHENSNPRKNLSFYKFLDKNAKKQQFDLLKNFELEKWIQNYLQKNKIQTAFDPKTVSLLASTVGNDLFLLKNELEKLITFKPEGTLTETDLEKMVKAQIQSNIFQTIEALLSQNKKLALDLFHQQIEKGEDVFYVFSMYIYQIRNLLKIADAWQNGNPDPRAIAVQTKLHPFVVQKSLSQIRQTSLEKLKKIYQDLEKIDQQVKTGQTDLVLALDRFIVGV